MSQQQLLLVWSDLGVVSLSGGSLIVFMDSYIVELFSFASFRGASLPCCSFVWLIIGRCSYFLEETDILVSGTFVF